MRRTPRSCWSLRTRSCWEGSTYEVFAESWPDRDGDIADRLNAMPKYVASRTLTDARWNSEVLQGDVAEAVARLKEGGDGTLLKYGTGPVSRALLEGGQLDELHLWVFPFIAGAGEGSCPVSRPPTWTWPR